MNEKLFNPDYLKHLCEKYKLRPSRQYGQNFLIDETVIEEMLAAGEVNKNDSVIEVGPGFGPLTFALAENAKQVTCFEIEKKLQNYWQDHCPKNVEIVWGNVLTVIARRPSADAAISPQSPRQLEDRHVGQHNVDLLAMTKPYKVLANLPYQITSNVIRVFLESVNQPESMTLMVQKEVGERICAKSGDMSLLSVAVQYYADPEIISIVPRSSFWPVPRVDSAILKLNLRPPVIARRPKADAAISHQSRGGEIASLPAVARNDNIELVSAINFFAFVKAGFSHRRKFLSKNLSSIITEDQKQALPDIFAKIGLKITCRAQDLSVDNWRQLVKMLSTPHMKNHLS